MSTMLAANEWGEFLHHRGEETLELRWLPAKMTDGAFKATLALLAWHAESVRSRSLLIDATKFHYTPGPGVMQWRDDAITPRYGAAGVRKFALVAPPGFPNTIEAGGKEAYEGSAVFPTAWFSERRHALDWLKRV